MICSISLLAQDTKQVISSKEYGNYSNTQDRASLYQSIHNNRKQLRKEGKAVQDSFRKIAANSKLIQYDYGTGFSLIALSMLAESSGQHEQAIALANEAIPYCNKSVAGKKELALAYNAIATAHSSLGNKARSLEFYLLAADAITTYKGAKLQIEMVYNNIASATSEKEQAFLYLAKAEAIARKRENTEALGMVLLNKAIILNKYEYYDSSKSILQEAKALGKSSGQPLLTYRSILRLSNHFLYKSQLDSALLYLLEANKLAEGSGESVLQLNAAHYLTGIVYYKLKQYKQANHYLQDALTEAKKMRQKELIAAIHNALAYNYKGWGDLSKAFEYQNLWIEVKDSIQNETIAKNLQHIETQYRVAEKDKELAQHELTIQQQQHKIAQKNKWIYISILCSVAIIIIGLTLYKFYKQQQKLRYKELNLLTKENEIGLLKGIMKGEEKERTRLARELHDGIGGMLTTANLSINRVITQQSMKENHGLVQLRNMIKDIAHEVRKAAHNLMPDTLTHHRLEEALMQYCDNINGSGTLRLELQTLGDMNIMEKPTELLFYRIAQELIQNVIKHAEAQSAVLQLVARDRQISISIEDDGKGFDMNQDYKGYGLQNLRYRVQALQGYISIQAAIGAGCNVYIEFDLDKLKELS